MRQRLWRLRRHRIERLRDRARDVEAVAHPHAEEAVARLRERAARHGQRTRPPGVARAAGETAPLLLVDSLYNPNGTQLMIFGHGIPNIPVLIYTASNLGIPEALARAWGAAFVLLGLILIANIGARLMLARYRARLGQ